jgi:hypothetical protein
MHLRLKNTGTNNRSIERTQADRHQASNRTTKHQNEETCLTQYYTTQIIADIPSSSSYFEIR